MPDAGRTRRSCVQKKMHICARKQRQGSRDNRRSLRNGLTAYTWSPRCAGLLATVACELVIRRLDPGVGGSGPHDFAVRAGRARLALPSRPSHPGPRFVTIAKRPSDGRDARINARFPIIVKINLAGIRSGAADRFEMAHETGFSAQTQSASSGCARGRRMRAIAQLICPTGHWPLCDPGHA